MSQFIRRLAFSFLALRGLIDVGGAGLIYRQSGSLGPSVAFMAVCCIFYGFLYFGIRNEKFIGRYGRRVYLWREPVAYWVCFAIIVLMHIAVTGFMLYGLLFF